MKRESDLNRLFTWLTGLRAAVSRWLVANLPPLAISISLALMLAHSVREAGWVENSQLITAMLLWAVAAGWMLAVSRWRGWLAGLYSLLLSLGLVALAMGQVLPPLPEALQTPYMPLVEGMRIRLVTFGLRAGGWLGTLQAGGSVRDTGLFLVSLMLVGWNTVVWMMWWLLRRHRALPGVIPFYLLMAVNVHLSRQPRGEFIIFTMVALLAIARSAFTHAHASWRLRKVDYSEELGPDWGVGASVAVTAIAALALVFSLVGTPEGLRLLSDFVERSRRDLGDTATQLFGGVNPPPQDSDEEGEGIPDVATPNLGRIGSPLPEGNAVVMWVGLSDPSPLPVDIGGQPRELVAVPRHYWRSQIFSDYTGFGWNLAPMYEGEASLDEEPSVPAGRYRLEQSYEIEARHSGVLFSVSDPTYASGATRIRQVWPDYARLVEGRATQYSVVSLAANASVPELENAPTEYPAEVSAAYLQLPAALPQRVRRLAEEVTASAQNPYRKAERIQTYLRTYYEYSLTAPLAPDGQDVVDHFLFDGQGGFCSHFASSMVVMLRSVGVPARVAAGYAMGSYDRGRGMYRVPVSASHAWVEVYFPGYGWVEFEPTPAYEVFSYPEGYGGSSPPLQAQPPELPPEVETGGSQLAWILVPVGLVAGLWAVYFWGRREKRRLSMPGKAALRLYERVRRGLARAGMLAQRAVMLTALTPGEFAGLALPELEPYPRLSEALQRATQIYIQSAYTPREPDIDDVLMGEAAWSGARSELFRLWIDQRFAGPTPRA